MAPKFGTSGLRGLAVELTDGLVADYVNAFLVACPQGRQVFVGRDLRPSSPRIAGVVLDTICGAGLAAVDCGTVPTPALAMAATHAGAGAVMVTGSHVPADRNGLKFYLPGGEASKSEEAAIAAAYDSGLAPASGAGGARTVTDIGPDFVRRYTSAFGQKALSELRVGVYRHSSVARDIMEDTLRALGAKVLPLASSDSFVPVDTEAVDPDTRAMLADWCAAHDLDAVVSTDGDGDRPMVTDAAGQIIPGDVLGVLTARWLGADRVVTPVSSNDMVNRVGLAEVRMTRIGSPFVIAGMKALLDRDPDARVVGFEANGGFLLGHAARGLTPLMTRDSLLPILAPLALARDRGLAAEVAALPPCFTAAARVQNIDRDRTSAFLSTLTDDPDAFVSGTGQIGGIDRTDGLRITFADGRVVHLRPSGNAPEFRVYAQADNPAAAEALVSAYIGRVSERVL